MSIRICALRTAIGALLCAGSVGIAHANLVLNGDFETGAFSPEWTATGGVSIEQTATYNGAGINGPLGAQYGVYVASFSGQNQPTDGDLFQTVLATTAGQAYQLEFDFGGWGSGGQFFSALATVTTDAFGGSILNIADAATTDLSTLFQHYSIVFTAGAGSTSLSLQFSDNGAVPETGSVDGLLDNVSLTAVNVPEPATLTLLGLALAGLGFSRRRKQKAS